MQELGFIDSSNDEFFLNPVLKYSRVKKTLIFSGELRKFDLVDRQAEQIEPQLLQSFRNSLLVALEEKKIAAHSLIMELDRFISDEGKGEGIGE
ncbi:MAG TPA: hypothetical protein DIW47_12115 [Bacteroidetes bacterium]|nr:hypothetical protein [Bacteroidota bacterium]